MSTEVPPLSVTELSFHLKSSVEAQYSNVKVRGEISGCKHHTSGHVYLALKDDKSVLDGVCWRGTASRLAVRPQDGMEVIARGKLTTYPGRSKYQLVIEEMTLAGEGALLKLLEERRRQLAQEGLFEEHRKKRLPKLPQKIGLITSPTGAVIQDILHRLSARCPRSVVLWPVAVQGEGAADQIAKALDGFNTLPVPFEKPDVIIVARGGGSLEDLWAFNEESVVRAVARSDIPVISGVGHEPDVTLIDYVADQRAPTPTAAAEMAVPVRDEVLAYLTQQNARLAGALKRLVNEAEQRVDDRGDRFRSAPALYLERLQERTKNLGARLRTPQQTLERAELQLANLVRRLTTSTMTSLTQRTQSLTSLGDLLKSYSYQAVLKRGFAVIKREDGSYLKQAAQSRSRENIELHFSDGACHAVITAGALSSPNEGILPPKDTSSLAGSPETKGPPPKSVRKKKAPSSSSQTSFWES